jgi:hypothetical protein
MAAGGARRPVGGLSRYLNPLALRRDTLAFITMVIEDAHRLAKG